MGSGVACPAGLRAAAAHGSLTKDRWLNTAAAAAAAASESAVRTLPPAGDEGMVHVGAADRNGEEQPAKQGESYK